MYRARRPAEELEVALKVLPNLEKVSVEGFLESVGDWGKLDRPNIAKLLSAGADPVPHIELEYRENTLANLPKPVSVDDAARYVFEAASGLAYAHERRLCTELSPPADAGG